MAAVALRSDLEPSLHRLLLRRMALPALAGLCAGPAAQAQGVATDADLAPVTITGTRSGLPASLAGSTAGKSAGELREQNLFNPEDALQYLPNTTVRKRYIGDRNALIGGRSFGTLQPSRALVYLDGYLISNFLGRFDAPRWNMISPEAIERVDVLYGPYSALYPGNSIGTTVVVTQRAPRALEISGRVVGYRQRFEQYGHGDRFDGHQVSLHLGQRLDSGLWFSGDLNHQNSTSQPMQYYAVSANAAGAFPSFGTVVAGTPTPVEGVRYDTDPKGLRRAVFGASGGAIDHTVQHTLNLRAGYRFMPTLEAGVMASWWTNNTETRNRTFLTDSTGAPAFQGAPVDVLKDDVTSRRLLVSNAGNVFELPASVFAPSTRDEFHQQLGATLKTRHGPGWNGSIVVSDYRIRDDVARQANNPEPIAADGGAGTVTRRNGTGWNTFEVQATWTPVDEDWTGGRHALAFGLHRNAYTLDSTVNKASDWRSTETGLAQYYRGKTEVTAVYAQDAWRLSDDLKLTIGLREEHYRAFDGAQLFADSTAVNYASRSLQGHSPKASLAWNARDDLVLKLSAGRGVRFPNVEELYNGTVTSASLTLFDPNLKPETSNALDLSAEKDWAQHRVRVSLFHDDVRDAILRQTDTTLGRNEIRVSNVDRVKTTGAELAWSAQDWLLAGLDLEANAAFTRAKVVANARDPQSVGKWWLRVPRTRGNLLAAYRPDEHWMGSVGVRHEGRSWGDTYNLDVNPDVYGGNSRLKQVDLRLAYRFDRQLELAAGVNNAANAHAYQFHPYPGRTLFAELRFSR
jgi:iron complex outermembrane receptor protein